MTKDMLTVRKKYSLQHQSKLLMYSNLLLSKQDIMNQKLFGYKPYLDKGGKQISLMHWAMLTNDLDYKVIKQHSFKMLDMYIFISTVWLGLDHSFGFSDEPLIFETMVFEQSDDDYKKGWPGEAIDTYRYSTYDQALAHHYCVISEYAPKQTFEFSLGKSHPSIVVDINF